MLEHLTRRPVLTAAVMAPFVGTEVANCVEEPLPLTNERTSDRTRISIENERGRRSVPGVQLHRDSVADPPIGTPLTR